ncbi:MAG TPA: hypothetical protein VKI65_09090 [Gemmataceae bacterium]|nr:hypothetical protein [Gemmataceae bacterium]
MNAILLPTRHYNPRWIDLFVLAGAAIVAAVSVRPYAGSWNDGSRLAAVESLVDHRTFAIDQSIFVQVPKPTSPEAPTPYPAGDVGLTEQGTRDKLFIDGHFYSDKTPVPSLLMAGIYQTWRSCGGATARQRPDLFCYVLTIGTSGLAYVLAIWCISRLAATLGLSLGNCLALTGSFALATVASTYTRHVNNHILFLGVMAAVMLSLVRLREAAEAGNFSLRPAWLGTLAGFAYNVDLGTGPVLLGSLGLLVIFRCRRFRPIAVFAAGVLPWFFAHHLFNYWIGGTIQPYNTVPEYSAWPGSPFNSGNLTGFWRHTAGHFVEYAAALLVGKRGFLCHNVPLFLLLPGMVMLVRRRVQETPELLFGVGWCGGTWLLYAALSNNYSGPCCSIRWFVPFLAPAYYVLALLLKRFPEYRWDFYVLSGWGAVLGILMWSQGPWTQHMVPFFWPIQGAALVSWCFCWHWRRRSAKHGTAVASDLCRRARAA